MRADTIKRIEAKAAELVKAVRPFSAENFRSLLPPLDQAAAFTTGDGYNLYHAFFQQLLAHKHRNSVVQITMRQILEALFAFQNGCQQQSPQMTPWFHEASPGNYTSQALHLVMKSRQIEWMNWILNWLIEHGHWTTLLGAKINYPLFGRFYFELDPRLMLGMDEQSQLGVLPIEQVRGCLRALQIIVSPHDEEFAEYVKIMQHFACYGFDGSSCAGSSVVWNFVCDVSKKMPSIAYVPATFGAADTTFPHLNKPEDRILFQNLVTLLPEMEDESGLFINVLLRDFLLGLWSAESLDAYANLYRLVKLHLKKSTDEAYIFGHKVFMYAYMLRYGDLGRVPDEFFKDMHEFIISCGKLEVSSKIDQSVLNLLLQLAEFSYGRYPLLAKTLYGATLEMEDGFALNQIHRYERRILRPAINQLDFCRFSDSLKRSRLGYKEFVELLSCACAVQVPGKLKSEHQKIVQAIFDGLFGLNKNLVSSLNLLARGLLKLDVNIFIEEGDFLKLELPKNCTKQNVEILVNRYTSCEDFRIHAVGEQSYVSVSHKVKIFRGHPKPVKKSNPVVPAMAAAPPVSMIAAAKPPEPKKPELPREELVNTAALKEALQECKKNLAPFIKKLAELEEKLKKAPVEAKKLLVELKQIQKDLSEALNENRLDRFLKLNKISGVTEQAFYASHERIVKPISQKCRRVALLVDAVQPRAWQPVAVAEAAEEYRGSLGLFAPIGSKPQGDRPVDQCLRGFGGFRS